MCYSRARQREQEAELEKAGTNFWVFLDWKGGEKWPIVWRHFVDLASTWVDDFPNFPWFVSGICFLVPCAWEGWRLTGASPSTTPSAALNAWHCRSQAALGMPGWLITADVGEGFFRDLLVGVGSEWNTIEKIRSKNEEEAKGVLTTDSWRSKSG